MPRIAVVTPMLPVAGDPTRGRYILETARALARRADVRVFLLVQSLSPRRAAVKVVDQGGAVAAGLDVETVRYPAVPWLTRLVNGVVASAFLTPRLRRFEPDVVLGYWLHPDGHAAVRSARALAVPSIVGALGSDIHQRRGLGAQLTRSTIRQADALLTVSRQMRQVAIDRFDAQAPKVHAIVNGIDTTVFHPRDQHDARRQLRRDATERLIVYVGRLVATKGLEELITAFRGLAARDARYRLAIIGQGPLQSRLETVAREPALAGRILLTGGLDHHGVAAWISASDLLTLPSWSEGYPNVLVEALACGRPVVATDVGGTREIVAEDRGLLVAARDAAQLERAMEAAFARDWDRAAIAAAVSRTWDDVASETLDVCRAVRLATRPADDARLLLSGKRS